MSKRLLAVHERWLTSLTHVFPNASAHNIVWRFGFKYTDRHVHNLLKFMLQETTLRKYISNLMSYQKPNSIYFAQDFIPQSQASLREVLSPAEMSFVLRKGCNVRAITNLETLHGQ